MRSTPSACASASSNLPRRIACANSQTCGAGFLQLRAAARDINASARARSPLRSATSPSNESARESRGSDRSARRAKFSTELSSPLLLVSCLSATSSSARGSQGATSRAPSGSEIAKLCPAVSATINTATRASAKNARTPTVVVSHLRERAALSFRLSPSAARLDLPMGYEGYRKDIWRRSSKPRPLTQLRGIHRNYHSHQQRSGSNSDADALGGRHEHMLQLYCHLLLRLLDPGHPPRAAMLRRLRSWSCRHVRT